MRGRFLDVGAAGFCEAFLLASQRGSKAKTPGGVLRGLSIVMASLGKHAPFALAPVVEGDGDGRARLAESRG